MSVATLALVGAAAVLAVAAGVDGSRSAAAVLGLTAAAVALRSAWQCGAAISAIERAVAAD